MKPLTVEIFDSTLRDGAQSEGIHFSVEDKLAIVKALDKLGVSFVEAGNPGSNQKDLAFFARAAELTLTHTQLVAFGSTRRRGLSPGEDANCRSLLRAGTNAVAIFGKCWDLHVTVFFSIRKRVIIRCWENGITIFHKRCIIIEVCG